MSKHKWLDNLIERANKFVPLRPKLPQARPAPDAEYIKAVSQKLAQGGVWHHSLPGDWVIELYEKEPVAIAAVIGSYEVYRTHGPGRTSTDGFGDARRACAQAILDAKLAAQREYQTERQEAYATWLARIGIWLACVGVGLALIQVILVASGH